MWALLISESDWAWTCEGQQPGANQLSLPAFTQPRRQLLRQQHLPKQGRAPPLQAFGHPEIVDTTIFIRPDWLYVDQRKWKIFNHWLDVLHLIRSDTLNGAGAGGGLDHGSGPLPLGYSAPDSALLASNYYNGGLYSDHDNILGRLSNQTRYSILSFIKLVCPQDEYFINKGKICPKFLSFPPKNCFLISSWCLNWNEQLLETTNTLNEPPLPLVLHYN